MSDTGALLAAVVETLPSELAVLDEEGTVVYTNRAWREFARANGLAGDPASIGENYLAAADAGGDDEHATRASAGLRALLDGERREFTLEYPCHGPDERRWFLMHATRLTHDGETYVQLGHIDITDRKLAELDVREKNERLSAVASILGHDIRNPLAVATGYLDLLADRFDDEPEALGAVRRALDRIDTIVADALVLARGEESVDVEAVGLGDCAGAAWRNVDTGDATLDVADDRRLLADGSLLENLFENLYRNAVEHAGPDVGVTVGATADGFYVADDGPGIPADVREAVFEGGFSTGEGGENVGLGLLIVREIAEAHGWTVAVTDAGGGGARFEVRGVSTPA